MDYDHGREEVLVDGILEVDVLLMEGTLKKNCPILLTNTVLKEKDRIWTRETRNGPPVWQELTLVILKQNGEEIPMRDDRLMSFYTNDFAASQIEFRHHSLASAAGGRVANPEAFNIKPKD